MKSLLVFLFVISLCTAVKEKCKPNSKSHTRLENALETCQKEFAAVVLNEAYAELANAGFDAETLSRLKREAPSQELKKPSEDYDEDLLTGCMIVCALNELNALDIRTLPKAELMGDLLSENYADKDFIKTVKSTANSCMDKTLTQFKVQPKVRPSEDQSCRISYNFFNCTVTEIELACSEN